MAWKVVYGKPSPGGRVRLPDEARWDRWPRKVRRMFKRVMREKGVRWLGSRVRRKMRGSKTWSQHSWPGQAHDFQPRSKKQGDEIVAALRRRFKRKFLVIWEQASSRKLHRDAKPPHFHVERVPKRTGTPPA